MNNSKVEILTNFFQDIRKGKTKDELFQTILKTPNIHIERIVSTGQITPEGEWYDQETDEWVILLQGEAKLLFENNEEIKMQKGNFVHLPAHKKHRVIFTSKEPPCVWLAVHWKNDN